MDTRWGRIRRAAFAAMIAMLVSFLNAPAFAAETVAADVKLAGAATCAGCHAEKSEAFAKTFHGRKTLSSAKLTNSCESCHGAGAAHADGGGDITKITNPKKLDAGAVADLCFTCHKDKSLMMWKTGAHATNEVSCLKCHNIHEGEGRKSLAKGGTETCLQCHKKQKADMNLASHHPVPEGKMTCVSCHNPHGGIEGNLKADSAEELCAKCHSEKVGPFANEHPPVADACSNCHVVHGSSNDRLMKQPVPMLCMGCHIRAHGGTGGQPNDNAAGVFKRGRCIDCHHDIHGSNQQQEFGQ